ncbi:hypothetical protein DCO46_05155 [Flavobacterium sp. HTF]|nr:hypothetical protein DCO46_05155 [Flavobacterium sp. HTF]
MKCLKVLFLFFILLLLSCDQEKQEKQEQSINTHFTICSFDLINKSKKMSVKPGAAIIDWPIWQPGQTIKIKFLDGRETEHEKVKKYVSEWAIYANLNFVYVPINENADIRIAFNLGRPGAWSFLGMESAYGTGNFQNEPSMRLGPLESNNESSIRRTVLHEFGHALGLIHETKNPSANIQWDLPKVYKYYSQWTKEEVDEYVINKGESTNYSEYDPLSIMHYYIPASITTNGVGVNEMNVLSDIDKKSINKWYPFPIRSYLNAGERIDLATLRNSVKSPNGRYSLEFNSGCLFILDTTNNQKPWSIGKPIYENASCFFQSNGEIIITGRNPNVSLLSIIWRNRISKAYGSKLYLKDDGSLELIHNGVIKWSSKSATNNQ